MSRTYTSKGEHRTLRRTQSLVDVLLQHAFEQRVSVGCEVGRTREFLREDLAVQFLWWRDIVRRVLIGLENASALSMALEGVLNDGRKE